MSRTPAITRVATGGRGRSPHPSEREFAARFADAINQATAIVAQNPDRRFPVESLPERLREGYRRIGPAERGDVHARARERLSGSPRDRRFWFGDYGERTADDWATSGRGLPPELSEPLRAAVGGHLASLDDVIAEQVSVYAGTHYADVLQPTTTLKVGRICHPPRECSGRGTSFA